ncbi:MAG: RimK/LysX family protein [Neomegalonema sp.]|nr:RimK/LysX family protein [Neomegalonema sp.]
MLPSDPGAQAPKAAIGACAPKRGPAKPMVIGWREHIALPDLKIGAVIAKIDTGARTSALHAVDIEPCEIEGRAGVSFVIPLDKHRLIQCRTPLLDERAIKNTSGQPQLRPVIATHLSLGKRRWKIELSLTDRADMKHVIILGRTAISRHNLLVDVSRSFLLAPPQPGADTAG